MTIVEGLKRIKSIRAIGRLGTIKGERATRANYANALARNEDAGIYQKKYTKHGPKISKEPWYWPRNPQTEKQQAWRAVFRAGKAAWDNLTTSQKLSYDERAILLKFTGYNLFMREYLYTHKQA